MCDGQNNLRLAFSGFSLSIEYIPGCLAVRELYCLKTLVLKEVSVGTKC